MTGVFEGVGSLQFTPDNKLAYAYSGVIGVTSTETTMLEFRNDSEYLDLKLQMFNESGSGDDMLYRIYLNDVVVISTYANSGNDFLLDTPFFLIIPPFTNVKITADNISAATSRNHTATITAKVAGAIQQENLEAITNNNKWASK